jgi:hypothetical protein
MAVRKAEVTLWVATKKYSARTDRKGYYEIVSQGRDTLRIVFEKKNLITLEITSLFVEAPYSMVRVDVVLRPSFSMHDKGHEGNSDVLLIERKSN